MSPTPACVDLDDSAALLEADHDGLLRAAASAGAQVRATAATVEEGALDRISDGFRPRTLIWLAGRGTAESAGAMLAAATAGPASQPVVVTGICPAWIGPLDIMIVAGDDSGDPALVAGAATAARRGAQVVVVAPYDGPLRDSTAGRAAVLAPRVRVPDEFGLYRYLAAGLAVAGAVDSAGGADPTPDATPDPAPDSARRADLAVLADELDAEALRNSVTRELFTNPAKALAGRMADRQIVVAGDEPATLALARHAAAVLLRVAGRSVSGVGLADVIAALRAGVLSARAPDTVAALFHDEDIDGPLPGRPRVFALALGADRDLIAARTSGFDAVDLLGCEDVGDAGGTVPVAPWTPGGVPRQLAVLALRLEMAAVYLRLAGG
ncbi:MAG: TobH protein [Mycobacterium sp.]|nr:TobH protein [Mycobacterium sp.]